MPATEPSTTDPHSLTIALVGCGRWGKHIARDLVSLGCAVIAVTRSEQSSARARDAGVTRLAASVHELEGIDGVVVATPTSTHAEVLEAVLTLGVPVYVEKPMTNDGHAAKRLVDGAGERLFVMDKWRYHPGIEALARIARTGELGEPVGLRTLRLSPGVTHDDVDANWVLVPHDLAIALHILGQVPEPRLARAEPGGAGLMAVLGDSPWHLLEVSAARASHRREVTLILERGTCELADSYSDHITIVRRDQPDRLEQRAIAADMPLERELAAFLDHLRGGPPPHSSADEGLAIVRSIEQLRQLAGIEQVAPA